jgi:hypothetical protein
MDADPIGSYELRVFYDEYFLPITENPVFTFVEDMGADAMTNSIATGKIEGKKVNMRRQVLSVAHLIVVDARTLQGADFTALTPDQQAAVESIANTLAESPFTSGLMVSVMNSMPSLYEKGLIPMDNLSQGEFSVVIDGLMDFLTKVDADTLGDDLDTILDFYFGFCDSGILAALSGGEDIMQFISDDYNGDRHILTMLNTLSGNERTKGIVDSLYNLVLSAAFDRSGEGEDNVLADVNISDVRDGLNNIVSVNRSDYETTEEYREVLSDTISTTINDTIGVELEQETVDEIADYIDENYAEQIEDLTDEEFNELMFEVVDIYQGYLNGEEILPDDLENLIPPQE